MPVQDHPTLAHRGALQLHRLYEALGVLRDASRVLNELEAGIDDLEPSESDERGLREAAGIPQAHEVMLAAAWIISQHTGERVVLASHGMPAGVAAARWTILAGQLELARAEGGNDDELDAALEALGTVVDGLR